ncbi:MAG: thioredoxin family protein [Alphaproteobacteria bacterium]|nr:thioredoxin family protein [Alphaproteobacteria bacterium]
MIALFFAAFSHAAAAEKIEESHSTITLTAENPGGRDTKWVAVTLAPRNGWHTYWKNSGDSGAAPIFEWTFKAGRIEQSLYPTPQRLPVGHLVNYGYSSPVTFLFEMSSDAEGMLTAEWLVCDVECVPQVAELGLLPTKNGRESTQEEVNILSQARETTPNPSYWDTTLEEFSDTFLLTIFAAEDELVDVNNAYFFPVSGQLIDHAANQSWEVTENGLSLILQKAAGATVLQDNSGVLVLSFDNGKEASFEIAPMVVSLGTTQEANPPQSISGELSAWKAAVFALVGGLILNLMPCVFPILSLKAIAFVSANYKTARNRRKEGWAYTLGIWSSFMVIVIVLIALREGGAIVGWGFQLQEPLFVAAMALLMTLVALSLSGLFTIQTGMEGAGHSLASREGVRGAFFKGVLAALVATPCTAPLMAPAIGFALTQSNSTVLIIFSLLAIGLALPFLLLSYSDGLARMMPRPGAWMEKVKEALAFPMYLTVAWLIYVFDRGSGPVATFVLMAAILATVFAVWLWQQSTAALTRMISLVIGFSTPAFVATEPWEVSEETRQLIADEVAFSSSALEELLEDGTPVFVYFTADWCITCKVNERIALMTDHTQETLKREGVVLMKGDWTNRDDEIARVLASHGRAGVPLYLFYPSGKKTPVVLPELIGPNSISDIVLGRID